MELVKYFFIHSSEDIIPEYTLRITVIALHALPTSKVKGFKSGLLSLDDD